MIDLSFQALRYAEREAAFTARPEDITLSQLTGTPLTDIDLQLDTFDRALEEDVSLEIGEEAPLMEIISPTTLPSSK